ncbi:dynamin family protein [Paenibacillus sp. JTLBN-2024]
MAATVFLRSRVRDLDPLLSERGVLMDTPGVDPMDDSHQKATHSALHLADTVLYVTDYNHAQPENNLAFAKKLVRLGQTAVSCREPNR